RTNLRDLRPRRLWEQGTCTHERIRETPQRRRVRQCSGDETKMACTRWSDLPGHQMVARGSIGRRYERRHRATGYQANEKRMREPMMNRLCGLILLQGLLLFPLPAWAQRIWDSDLKRYLTEQEMSMAEVFLGEEEAVKLMFPKSERIKKDL